MFFTPEKIATSRDLLVTTVTDFENLLDALELEKTKQDNEFIGTQSALKALVEASEHLFVDAATKNDAARKLVFFAITAAASFYESKIENLLKMNDNLVDILDESNTLLFETVENMLDHIEEDNDPKNKDSEDPGFVVEGF